MSMSIIQPRVSFVADVAAERVPDRALRAAIAKCMTCGAALEDVSQRFCGGDRCDRVWMRHSTGSSTTMRRQHAGDELQSTTFAGRAG
jgi:hypothetical protein